MDKYEYLVHENPAKYEQIRLTINEFRDVEYLHLRKYYLDFDGNWVPTPDGIAMELDLNNSRNLFIALVEILSLAEAKDTLETHFKDLLDSLYT